MVVGVTAGVLLAALLFIQKMAQTTTSQIVEPKHHQHFHQVPSDVLLYDINGPLFFGAAETAVEAIDIIHDQVKCVFLLMEDVPVMDVTGLVALESAIEDLMSHQRTVYLVGVKHQPRQLMLKSDSIASAKDLFFCASVQEAVSHHQANYSK
jgi:SulP family sulfate permease